MSVRQAARRLALSGPSPPSAAGASRATVPVPAARGSLAACAFAQRRQKWSLGSWASWGSPASKGDSSSASKIGAELDDPKKRKEFLEGRIGGSAEGSIFQDDIEAQPTGASSRDGRRRPRPPVIQPKTRETMAIVTDPNPRARIRWHRKKVIQMVRSNGQLSREDHIKMSERELLHKSHFLPTSVKKLVMLSRQIAGKTVDDAITQMRWSKKKMSAEIKYYLEEARDLAIAERGMGLGKVNGETLDKPRKIKTRDGKWMEITDPTRIYIAQSWVGRGPWRGKSIDYKARGSMGIIQHPSTSFTVLLKEEKTRMREYEEDEAKKAAKGPWVHLPDRPIHGQRPYYTW